MSKKNDLNEKFEVTKTLENCTGEEFLSQTFLASAALSDLYEKSGYIKTLSREIEIDEKLTAEEREIKENEQRRLNIKQAFTDMFTKFPKESIRFLALCCFVDPDNMTDEMKREVVIKGMSSFSNPQVVDFFISSKKLGI